MILRIIIAVNAQLARQHANRYVQGVLNEDGSRVHLNCKAVRHHRSGARLELNRSIVHAYNCRLGLRVILNLGAQQLADRTKRNHDPPPAVHIRSLGRRIQHIVIVDFQENGVSPRCC
ncbi:hypothetical protein D3C71_1488700 [compost metagenome]